MHSQKVILSQGLETVGFVLVVSLGLYLLGFLLNSLSRKTRETISTTTSPGIFLYLFFPGIMIHEISHLLAALVFLYKIEDVKLIDFSGKDGSHGHVISRPREIYNFLGIPRLWQLMGNLFIGIAPLVVGPGLMLVWLYFIVPGGRGFIQHPGLHSLPAMTLHLGVWLYVTFATISNIELSSADLDGVWKGFLYLVLSVFLVATIQAEIGVRPCLLRCVASQKAATTAKASNGN